MYFAQLAVLAAATMEDNALTPKCVSAPWTGKGAVVLLVSIIHWNMLLHMHMCVTYVTSKHALLCQQAVDNLFDIAMALVGLGNCWAITW